MSNNYIFYCAIMFKINGTNQNDEFNKNIIVFNKIILTEFNIFVTK